MNEIQYKNFLISDAYSFTGKTKYFKVWKLNEEGDPFDVWGDNFQSVRQAKTFIDMESAS
jgi:hypothetical protein